MSQSSKYNFTQYTVEDGLSENIITSLLQDQWGFIWVGTASGLAKFDGGNFKVYKFEKENPYSLTGWKVEDILEGRDGRLWISTDKGLNSFDRITENFTFYPTSTGQGEQEGIHSLLEDQKGNIWGVKTLSQTLVRLNIATKELTTFRHDSLNSHSIGHDKIFVRSWWWKKKGALTEDKEGNIWIGLADGKGLDCFDNTKEQFIHYRRDTTDVNSLSSNEVTSLFCDSNEKLWIGTMDGLNLYNETTDDFTVYKQEIAPNSNFSNNKIFSINEDKTGQLWLCKWLAVETFDPQQEIFTKHYTVEHKAEGASIPNRSLQWIGENQTGQVVLWSRIGNRIYLYDRNTNTIATHFNVNDISNRATNGLIDQQGLLWLGSNSGLFKQRKTTTQFESIANQELFLLEGSGARSFYEVENNILWVGGRNGVLRTSEKFEHLLLFKYLENNPTAFQGVYARDMLRTKNGDLWVSSDKGLNLIRNPSDTSFTVNLARNRSAKASTFEVETFGAQYAFDGNPETRWASIYEDPQWISVDLGAVKEIGRIVLKWENASSKSYKIQVSNDERNWKTVFIDEKSAGGQQQLMLKTRGRYIRLLGLSRNTTFGHSLWEFEVYPPLPDITCYRPTTQMKANYWTDIMHNMELDEDGNIWTATLGGLLKFTPNTKEFELFEIKKDAAGDASNFLFEIRKSNLGKLWLEPSTRKKGVWSFDIKTEQFTNYQTILNDSTSLNGSDITDIYRDKSGDIWISADLGGLNRYQPIRDNFKRYLGNSTVLTMYEDSQDRFWIGTAQEGLFLLDKTTGHYTNYTEKEGLIYDRILDIQEDDFGFLWLTTIRGLSKFNPTTEVFESFDEKDGLIINNDFQKSYKDKNGNIYIGGGKGLNIIRSSSIEKDTSLADILITELWVENEEEVEKTHFSTQKLAESHRVTLDHDQNTLKIQYASLNFKQPEKNEFLIKLEPIENEWRSMGTQQFINYIGLAAGKYTFRVKMANTYDGDNAEAAALEILIRHPWWQRWWAFVLYGLAILGLLFKVRKYEIRRQEQKLEKERKIYAATSKFVPNEFLSALGRANITQIELGDHVEKKVTVFFSDIRNYTSIAEQMTPEENFRFVNAFNGRMGPIIHQQNGFINQYLGDSIMAIFPKNALDALKAAVIMQQTLQTFNLERMGKNRVPVRIGIGMHSGSLIMGIIGDEKRMDAATIADTVNIASRIENLTKYYGANILLSEESWVTIEEKTLFNVRFLGKVIVKGKQTPVGVYECFDGDSPKSKRLKQETKAIFATGLTSYLAKDFATACDAFDKVLSIHVNDKAAQILLKKAKTNLLEGVGEDWTGVELMTRK